MTLTFLVEQETAYRLQEEISKHKIDVFNKTTDDQMCNKYKL